MLARFVRKISRSTSKLAVQVNLADLVRPTFKADLVALGVREDLGVPVDTRASLNPEVREDLAVRPTFKADLMALGVREDLGVSVDTRASRPSASKTQI